MSRYDNIICPVCKKPFKEGDDIVVCPECGTPHHRACYAYVGHCVNKGLHKTGFNFNEAQKTQGNFAAVTQNPQLPAQTPVRPQANSFGPAQFPPQNTQNQNPSQNEPFNQGTPFPGSPYANASFENDPQTIDGESMADVAAAVRTNVPRFTSLFKKFEKGEKKLSWNWGAFFFGSLYYFYRKIYRQAISLLCIAIILLIGSNFALTNFAPKTMEIVKNAAEYASQNNVQRTNEILAGMESASDYGKAMTITYIFMGAFLVLRIIEALAADRIYKKNVITLIKRVRVQLDSGATFSMPFASDSETENLSQQQMRRYYLSSKGGVNIFSPILALFIAEMILSLL